MSRARSALVVCAALAAAFAAAACGSSSSPSPSPSPIPTATVAPSPSGSAANPFGSGLPSIAIPSLNGAPDLAATLPDQLGGETLQKISFGGSDMSAAGDAAQPFAAVLGQLGKSPSDVSLAVAFSATSGASVGAFRINGLDAGTFLNLYEQQSTNTTPDITFSQVSLGGKQVVKASSASDGSTQYIYVTGDTLYFVQSDDPTILQEAFSKLP